MIPVLAGTGHRPDKLGGYGGGLDLLLTKFAVRQLAELEPALVITGMALGWDTALALACDDLDIPFIAAVPFPGQAATWPRASQERYQYLLSVALEVEVVSLGEYAGWKMQMRNRWMVDRCSHVLALWNGTDGGTANCVRYAERAGGRPVLNVWDQWEAFRRA